MEAKVCATLFTQDRSTRSPTCGAEALCLTPFLHPRRGRGIGMTPGASALMPNGRGLKALVLPLPRLIPLMASIKYI